MKKNIKILTLVFFVALSICEKSFAQKTPIENLYEYNLENGLTLFASENHSVPLVYVEIAFRTGATSQTAQNSGLFHLYEHMMFKGNSLYKDAASMNKALSDLGVSNWNGSTGTDCVNYFFTIPSDKIVEGLEFWNAAIRTPLMNETEFENEKKVVLSEIQGSLSEPLSIYGHFVNYKMFPASPYRTDSGGSLEVIKNATVAQLRQIQKEYYVPSNAALFVGGDINPEQIFELTKQIFGSWENQQNKQNQQVQQVQQSLKPFQNDEFYFMNYDKLPENLAQIQIYFRGPDTDFDIQDTYAADYLLMILNEPGGLYDSYFSSLEDFNLYQNTIWASYGTSRASGIFSFGATISLNQNLSQNQQTNNPNNLAKKSEIFLNDLRTQIFPQIAKNKSLFSKKTKNRIVAKLSDEQLQDSETAAALLSKIRFWWCCASTQYYYNYIEEISKVSQKDVQNFIKKYFSSPAMTVILSSANNFNSDDFTSNADFADSELNAQNFSLASENSKLNDADLHLSESSKLNGENSNISEDLKRNSSAKKFTKITQDNAFWWKDEKFALSTNDFSSSENSSLNTENFSLASEDLKLNAKNSKISEKSKLNGENSKVSENQIKIKKTEYVPPKIETYYLKNKIPVYVQKNSSHNVEVAFAVRGGVENLTKETSGLESALFNLMSLSSKKFSQNQLDAISYKTGLSFSKTNKMTGSAFGISVLDKYLKETLCVLENAFLNPQFTQENFEQIQVQVQRRVKNIQNDVQTMLSYEIQQELYKNHPYEVSTLVTLDSAQNITLENLKNHHEKILDAGKIFVVAVGNFDSVWLVKELNKSLGKLKVLGDETFALAGEADGSRDKTRALAEKTGTFLQATVSFAAETDSSSSKVSALNNSSVGSSQISDAFAQETGNFAQSSANSLSEASVDFENQQNQQEKSELYKNPPALKIQKLPDVILRSPNANGTGFVARVFASPSNTSSEYIPAAICADIFSDLLFNVVREHYGACYSPSSYVVGSKAPYGAEYIYRLSDFENYKKYMQEARNYMSQNKLIESQNQNGEYVFTSIENRLEGYKNSYINSTYASSQTSEGLALKLIYNLLQFNDINYDLVQLEQVHNLTSSDIQSVFKKYWLSENTRWFMVFGLDVAK